MSEDIIIGVDLAKNVFQLHGATGRSGLVSQETVPCAVQGFLRGAPQLPDEDGGMFDITLLGA